MRRSSVIWLFISIFLVIATVGVYLASQNQSAVFSLTPSNFATPFTGQLKKSSESEIIELLFAGDVMLDRNIRLKAEKYGYGFLIGPHLNNLIKSTDHVIVNLEGPITDNQSVSVGSAVGSTRNFIFTFSPAVTSFMRDQGITAVNLGNNHILNFGQEGLTQTYNFLDEAGIDYFGFTGTDQSPKKFVHIIDHNSYQIGLVNYNQFISGGEYQVFDDLANLAPQVDYLIVYTHWGNEYVPENAVLKELAHQFVDAGADLIIGSHPHVITGNEVYKEKHIYYSLGNFIFDQYFEPAVKQGLVVKAGINAATGETIITEYKVTMDGSGQTELAEIIN